MCISIKNGLNYGVIVIAITDNVARYRFQKCTLIGSLEKHNVEKAMNYKTNEFLNYLWQSPDAHHILVLINKPKPLVSHPSMGNVSDNGFCAKLDGVAQLYVSVNLCRKMYDKPKISDVTHWTTEYIDLDCERPDHSIPATDEELAGLKGDINDINNWLGMNGIMNGYFDFTGNGYRWLLPVPPVDLRGMNVEAVMLLNEQKKEFLRIIKRETGANIDTSVGELSRITGIPGTMNVKARDGTDRRREPFRGCDRLEDKNLRDYIMAIDITDDDYGYKVGDWSGGVLNDIVTAILPLDKALKTMFNNASLIKKGHQSEYDYAILLRLRKWQISPQDCIGILRQHGTRRAQTKDNSRPDYVERTVMNTL